jgi:predicted secreted protein
MHRFISCPPFARAEESLRVYVDAKSDYCQWIRPKILIVFALAFISACGGSTSHTASHTTTADSPSTATTGVSATTTTAAPGGSGDVRLTEADRGNTVTLATGERATLVLNSTYWTVQDSSDPAVLRRDAEPTVQSQPHGCVPGGGCGTVTAAFTAVGSGSAMIVATRTSCGEAMGCTGGAGLYQVRVRVSS